MKPAHAIAMTHATQVQSASRQHVKHSVVIHVSARCSCEAFAHRQTCPHVIAEMNTLGRAMAALKTEKKKRG